MQLMHRHAVGHLLAGAESAGSSVLLGRPVGALLLVLNFARIGRACISTRAVAHPPLPALADDAALEDRDHSNTSRICFLFSPRSMPM